MDRSETSITASCASKLPVSRLTVNKKRVALEESNEQPALKNVRLDLVPEFSGQISSKKAVAIVKPVESTAAPKATAPKNHKTVANKLKRRSVVVLNKNSSNSSKSGRSFNPASKTREPLPAPSRAASSRQVAAKRSNENFLFSQSIDEEKKKSRPAWDVKGRLQDMEEQMKSNKNETSLLRNRLIELENQKVQLENTAQQKQQISQEAFGQVDSLRRQLDSKSTDLEEITRKYNSLLREKNNLESELNAATIKCSELTKSMAELSSSQISLNVQLDTTKTFLNDALSKISSLTDENRKRDEKIIDLENRLNLADDKNRNLEMIRRKLHNAVQELKGNIRVFCRVRPLLPNERPSGYDLINPPHIVCSGDEPTKIQIVKDKCMDATFNESSANLSKYNCGPTKREMKHDFDFDRVFDWNSDQTMIFEEISQLVQSAVDGYNVCIFAYGQTGSGKTYTMQGPEDRILAQHPETAGIIPLAVRQIFAAAHELSSKGWTYKLEASFLEIYNEKVRDLLTEEMNEDQNLEIKLSSTNSQASKGGAADVCVPGLTVKIVENESQIEQLITFAVAKRAKASTKCNARSSRSHSVFRLRITGSNRITGVTCDGLLSLVDLAGSERLKESQSEGDRLKEAQNINKSLSSLGQVITALAQKDNHVPYRNSKLTFLLQNSLGGNSKTLMFVNISPNEEHMNETINSLKFASKVNECHIGSAFKKN